VQRSILEQQAAGARVIRAPRPAARRRRRIGHQVWGPLYALPAAALIIIFIGYPLGSIVYHAFTQWDGLSAPQWVGLHNFSVLLHDPIFRTALKNNLLFAISVPIQLVVPLGLAYLIHERIPGWRFFRFTFFLPAVLSTVIVGILASFVLQLNGPLNEVLGTIGLHSLENNWLASAGTSIPMIIVVVVWANFGYNVLIYLGGLSTIDPSLAEAARIDGATGWQVLRHVYIPNLRRVMELVLVINTVTAFAYMFAYIYTITNGGPGFDTYTSEFYIYTQAFTEQNLGYASALGMVLTIILASIGYIQIRALTKGRG
jgi:ABC-type sugar transport system permease subunit